MALVQREIQTASSEIFTWVTDFISYADNHYAKLASIASNFLMSNIVKVSIRNNMLHLTSHLLHKEQASSWSKITIQICLLFFFFSSFQIVIRTSQLLIAEE